MKRSLVIGLILGFVGVCVICVIWLYSAYSVNKPHTPETLPSETSVAASDVVKQVAKAIPEVSSESGNAEYLQLSISTLQDALRTGDYFSKYFTADDIAIEYKDDGAYVCVANCRSKSGYKDDNVPVYWVEKNGNVQDCESIVDLSNYLYQLSYPNEYPNYKMTEYPVDIEGYRCVNNELDRTSYQSFEPVKLRGIFTQELVEEVQNTTQNEQALEDTANFLYTTFGKFQPEAVKVRSTYPLELTYKNYLMNLTNDNGTIRTDYYAQ